MTNQITLKTNADDIQSLVVKFLGRGLRSRVVTSGAFRITQDNLFDLHRRITQRVSTQNDSRVVDYYLKYRFSDNSEELIPSDADFAKFRYLGEARCISVELNYSLLLRFPTRDFEKQQITVEIAAPDSRRKRKPEISIVSKLIFDEIDDAAGRSFLSMTVEYTDYIWANDVKNMFKQYCAERIEHHTLYSALHKVVNFGRPFVDAIVSFAALFGILHLVFIGANSERDRILAITEANLQNIYDRMGFLIENNDSFNNPSVFIPAFAAAVFFPTLFLTLLRLSVGAFRPHAFIILNEHHERAATAAKDGMVRRSLTYVVGAVVTVALGVAATRIDDLLHLFGM